MPYDPTTPINDEIADADVIREKFAYTQARIDEANGRIDSIPAGPQGEKGDPGEPGPAVNSFEIGSVTTVGPDDPAAATITYDGITARLTFALPRGADGPAGAPFITQVTVNVTMLDPNDAPAGSVVLDGSTAHLSLSLPRGATGATGEPGPQGLPGEVSAQQLAEAIATTARNPNTVAPFPGTFSDPPTKAEMDAYAAWNEQRWQAAMR